MYFEEFCEVNNFLWCRIGYGGNQGKGYRCLRKMTAFLTFKAMECTAQLLTWGASGKMLVENPYAYFPIYKISRKGAP